MIFFDCFCSLVIANVFVFNITNYNVVLNIPVSFINSIMIISYNI